MRIYGKGGTKSLKKILILVDDDVHYLFKLKCSKNRTTMQKVLRDLIEEYIKNIEEKEMIK